MGTARKQKKADVKRLLELDVGPNPRHGAALAYFVPLCQTVVFWIRSHIRVSRKQAVAHCIGRKCLKWIDLLGPLGPPWRIPLTEDGAAQAARVLAMTFRAMGAKE